MTTNSIPQIENLPKNLAGFDLTEIFKLSVIDTESVITTIEHVWYDPEHDVHVFELATGHIENTHTLTLA